MERTFALLLFVFFLGLFLTVMLRAARTRWARLAFFWISLFLVNGATLAILLAVFAVSRLSGSTPPGLAEILRPLLLPILLIGLIDAAVLILNRQVKRKTG